jgi:hypothetical protein
MQSNSVSISPGLLALAQASTGSTSLQGNGGISTLALPSSLLPPTPNHPVTVSLAITAHTHALEWR